MKKKSIVSALILFLAFYTAGALFGARCSAAKKGLHLTTMLEAEKVRTQYGIYLDSMLLGLRKLDRPDGLPVDTVYYTERAGHLTPTIYKIFSGPTDIGMKIIAYVGALKILKYRGDSIHQLTKVVEALEKLPYHASSGLFFRLYDPVGFTDFGQKPPIALNPLTTRQVGNFPVVDAEISAIDNFHLYLGLFTLARQTEQELLPLTAKAKALFERMDFSVFYDPTGSSMGVNLKYRKEDSSEDRWTLEDYRAGFNSEVRELLAGLYALNGLKAQYANSSVLEKILQSVPIETDKEGQLMTWTGGGFEADLPVLTLGESKVSSFMLKNSQTRMAKLFGEDLLRANDSAGKAVCLPYIPSASVTSVKSFDGDAIVNYTGAVGREDLQVSENHKAPEQQLIVPHAALLLAATNPAAAAAPLLNLEKMGDRKHRLFDPENGWLASMNLVKQGKLISGKVNLAQTAVDGYFALLGILTALDSDHLSPSARALLEDSETAKRLRIAYGIIDRRTGNSAIAALSSQ